jgi:hypothetical protein
MPTECSSDLFGFSRVEGRSVVAAFDGGVVSSDAGALLLGAADRAIGLVDRFAACFGDARAQAQVIHEIPAMVGQRVFGIRRGPFEVCLALLKKQLGGDLGYWIQEPQADPVDWSSRPGQRGVHLTRRLARANMRYIFHGSLPHMPPPRNACRARQH